VGCSGSQAPSARTDDMHGDLGAWLAVGATPSCLARRISVRPAARFTAVAAVVAALAGSAAAAALDRTGPPSSPARCRSLSPSARSSPLRYPAAVPAGCCWPRPPPWGRRGAHESRCPWRGDGPWLSTRRRVPGRHQAGPASGGNAGRRRFGEVPTTAPAAGPSTTGPSRAPGAWTGPARDGAGSRCRYRRSQRRLSRWCSPPPPAARCS